MLGIWALGERALGQLIGRTTATLLVSQGSFSLAGQSVTFKVAEAVANGSFTLTGQAVTFAGTEFAATGFSIIETITKGRLLFSLLKFLMNFAARSNYKIAHLPGCGGT